MTTAPHFQTPIIPYLPTYSPTQLADWQDYYFTHFPTQISPLTMSEPSLHPTSRLRTVHQNGQTQQPSTSQLANYDLGAMSSHSAYSTNIPWNSNTNTSNTNAEQVINHHSHTQHTYSDHSQASYGWTADAAAYNTPVDDLPGSSAYITHHSSPGASSHTQSPYSNSLSSLPLPRETPATSVDLVLSPGYSYSGRSSPLTPARSPEGYPYQMAIPESTPTREAYTHKQQQQMFRDVITSNTAGNFGPFIPQRMYKPHTSSDLKRYVEEVKTDAPIFFWTTQPDECGIPLSDALHSRVRRLIRRDETVFEGRGPSVSIRIEWPGYRSWSRQIPTKDFKSPPGPITLAKLTKNIAKCVQRFLGERQNQAMDDDADPKWRIGPGRIELEHLVLVSLHQVSLGSWQPHLRLRSPFHHH